MAQPLFGIVPAGLPVITVPSEAPSPTSFLYSLPTPSAADGRSFNHVVLFLLPGVELPPGTAAAIYLVTPPAGPGQTVPQSRFLGGVGPGKESAIFKIGGGTASSATAPVPTVLGVSIEDGASVAARIEELRAAAAASSTSSTAVVAARSSVPPASAAGPSTLALAQRIIQNAFNFLSSYSTSVSQGPVSAEVVPMKAIEEWWHKLEGRLRSDPTFLERTTD